MTAEEFALENMQGTDLQEIESALIGFAKLKCKELLEIVSEKAKIREQKNIDYRTFNTKTHEEMFGKIPIDKDSILKAVDLDNFIV